MNRIPAFTAEASLFRTGSYNATGSGEVYSSSVVPQLKKDDDDVSNVCKLLCFCCLLTGLRYCCARCTVCKIATILGDDGTILT
jgi:hypothetical protein